MGMRQESAKAAGSCGVYRGMVRPWGPGSLRVRGEELETWAGGEQIWGPGLLNPCGGKGQGLGGRAEADGLSIGW